MVERHVETSPGGSRQETLRLRTPVTCEKVVYKASPLIEHLCRQSRGFVASGGSTASQCAGRDSLLRDYVGRNRIIKT